MTQRLIDANAYKEALKTLKLEINDGLYSDWEKACDNAIALVESAPTVETTDDVLARMPDGTRITKFSTDSTYEAYEPKSWKVRFGNTAFEAVKNLEASINRK